MSEVIDYSDLPDYDPEINKIILKGARDALVKNYKEDLIHAQEKLEKYLPGRPKSFVAPEVEKAQVIAETLATLGRKVEVELAKKVNERKELLEKKKHEALVMVELEKADAISGALADLDRRVQHHLLIKSELHNKIEEQIKVDGVQHLAELEVEKLNAIAEILGDLRRKIEYDIEMKSQPEEIEEKKSELNPELIVIPEVQKLQEVAEALANLEENVERKIAENETQKKDTETEEMVKSVILSGAEKMHIIADTLADLTETVEQGLEKSLIDFQVEKVHAIADVLAILGEKVDREISTKFGCPDETIHELAEILATLKEKFDKNIAHRAFGFQIKLHETIMNIVDVYCKEIDVTYTGFECLISMSKDQPAILNEEAITLVFFFLNNFPIAATRQQILRWLHICLIQSEQNRCKLYNMGILLNLKILIDDDTTTSPVIYDTCQAIKALVEFKKYTLDEKSSTTALIRIDKIANTLLAPLTYFLHKFLGNKALIVNILATIRKLLVQNYMSEVFIYVKKGKALLYLYDIFIHHNTAEDVIYELLQLFNVMVGNDTAKATMMEAGVAYIMKQSLDAYNGSAQITATIFMCIAKISLRCPLNTALLVDFGFPAKVVHGMRKHSSDVSIQKTGSWLIRVFTTYNNEIVPLLIQLPLPQVLHELIEYHKYKCEFDAKATLRDLYEELDLYEPISKPIVEPSDIEFPL